ncbi:hypothetical protein FHT82_003351, partial [Rhizobium sp. BK275]|nr:hypothetical protein [Rhizobium sp. BK275]
MKLIFIIDLEMENLSQAHHAVFEGRGSCPVLQMCEEDLGRRS